jgi:hypothetical protein
MKKLRFVQSLLLLGLLVCPVLFAYARPVVLTIDARSDNGTQIGTAVGTELQKNFPDLETQYDSYLAFLLSSPQFKQLIPQVKSLITAIDPNYQSEVSAIASVLQLDAVDGLGDGKLSVNEFWLLQFLTDLTGINKGSAIAVPNRDDNNPVTARNVDWKSTADLRSLQTISVYHYEGRTLVSIGLAGMVGVINGFNDQGLFVSELDASISQVSTAGSPKNSSSFDLRTMLKQYGKIGPASHEVSLKPYLRSHLVLLADQENAAVLEQPADGVGMLRKMDSALVNEMPWNNQGQLAAINCFVLKISPHNCQASRDYFRWGRFSQLLKPYLGKNLSANHAVVLMQDPANPHQAIFNEDTLQSIVFTPKDRALYLYTQPAIKTDAPNPVVERFQFVDINATFKDKLMDIGLLVLGFIIFAVAWIYVFRGDKKFRWKRLSK